MSTIYDWSLTASENGGADSLINWSEGQSPNTVNNSARMMMQRVKEYLSDTGGAFISTFKIDDKQKKVEIYLNSHTVFSKYQTGIFLRFQSPCTTIGVTTVSLNGLASQPVYKATATGLVQLTGGELQQGCLYSLVYDEEITGWQLLNPTIQKSTSLKRLPCGLIGPFAMENLPSGWLLCDGRAYSREDYRDLFLTIGTSWGAGDGVRTFNVPDLRGVFLRGLDGGRNVDPWRSFASFQGCSLKSHDHFIGPSVSERFSSRKKRDLSVEASLPRRKRAVDEECVGLSDDGYEKCQEAFEELTEHTKPFWFTEADKPARLPWFIRSPFANFLYYSTPITQGLESSGHHEHHLLAERVGGEETRPINVSVVFGIKT
ncbi:phage tail protein [Bartonella machadoae]|uniref:phage tail protein n=1 Tax=Bartonella machadoae TaxID=2893471 RepID=UPI001F4C899E|nr:phage tail protein [Bartonella machadoae]UNE54980.1 phage tail protein [Bartonella machadoae]UNE55370.1 phage tail protein [Bartonella machadoae]